MLCDGKQEIKKLLLGGVSKTANIIAHDTLNTWYIIQYYIVPDTKTGFTVCTRWHDVLYFPVAAIWGSNVIHDYLDVLCHNGIL